MGDRGNIYVLPDGKDKPGIYFYFHWDGYNLRRMLRNALKEAEGRWDDPAYATRVLASELFAEYKGSLTGAGISLTPIGGEYPILVLDFERQRVYSMREGKETKPDEWPSEFWPFNQYVAVDHPEREYGEN